MNDCSSHPASDRAAYHDTIRRHLSGYERVLDLGCGRGKIDPFPWDQYPNVELIGTDPDCTAAENPYLSEFRLMTNLNHWDIEDACFDVVVARYVMEHVREPHAYFAEVARALKNNGKYIFLTPNIMNPAIAIAKCLPVQLKRRLLRTQGVREQDVFPAFYRANFKWRIKTLATAHALQMETLIVRDFNPCFYWDLLASGLSDKIFNWTQKLGLEPMIGIAIIGVLCKSEGEFSATPEVAK